MILPALETLLDAEKSRHLAEMSAIARFHAFITEFETSGGCIGGVQHRLRGISIPGNVASFESDTGETYFFDGNKNPALIADAGDDDFGAPV